MVYWAYSLRPPCGMIGWFRPGFPFGIRRGARRRRVDTAQHGPREATSINCPPLARVLVIFRGVQRRQQALHGTMRMVPWLLRKIIHGRFEPVRL